MVAIYSSAMDRTFSMSKPCDCSSADWILKMTSKALVARLSALMIVSLTMLAIPRFASADTLDRQRQALKLITDTADNICNVVLTEGGINRSKIEGTVKAQLGGLASKLADAGISGDVNITSEQYQNVLQQDLAATLRSNAECKLKVFSDLQNQVLGTAVQPEAPSQDRAINVFGRYTGPMFNE